MDGSLIVISVDKSEVNVNKKSTLPTTNRVDLQG